MAITGTGTQADPFIVHNYTEFISLSNTLGNEKYIQFFENENPNQVIDCNDYGSEFKWHAFVPSWPTANGKIHINLNGCTIKNLRVADGETMFLGKYNGTQRYPMDLDIRNGSIRNVFMGSSTSKFCGDHVEFHDVSISLNFAGSTVSPFNGDGSLTFDNCAMYLVGSTLQAPIMTKGSISDTDIELRVANQNGVCMFPNCSFTDCRVQGKISGNAPMVDNAAICPMGARDSYYSYEATNWINCVIDIDFTGINNPQGTGTPFTIIYAYSAGINTNVMCKSHVPQSRVSDVPADWNYMSHENIRNGTYLNNAGFTVVEVAGAD